jgi:uncharacterized protein YbjT (DUF2867 family)
MILVVGATGNTGRETVPRLLERGIAVRALSRDPERARALPGFSGAEIVAGDPARPETLEPAMQGVTKVFLIPPSGPGSDTSEQNVIEAARRAGVRHIVKLSALCADPSAPSMALSHNYRAEEILKSSGVPYTILRPSSFMQNFLYYYSASIRGEGAVYQSLGEARMAIIDTRDIAEVAIKVLTSEGHEGKTYDLTGPEALTYAEAAEKLGAAIGRPVRYVDVPAAAYEQALVGFGLPPFVAAEVVNIYGRGPYREGKAGSISSSVADLLGRPARSFSEFARDHAAYFLP